MAKGVQHAAAALIGLPEAPITGISVDGFWVSYDPNATPGVPVMASNVGPELHAGIITEFARLGGDLTVLSPEEI